MIVENNGAIIPHSSLRITNNNIIRLTSRSPVDRGYEPFFHISIVEGDISLVLDNEALSRYKTFPTRMHADIYLIIIIYSASRSSEYFLLKFKYAKESVGPH